MRRLLLKYSKQGDAAFLSHRETMRALERSLRRSRLPLTFTEGYSPRPRMSFSPALPLGVAAEVEYLEVAVDGEVDTTEARDRLNMALPEGLRVNEIICLAPKMPKLSRWTRYGLYRIESKEEITHLLMQLSGDRQGRLKDAMDELVARLDWTADRRNVARVGLYASRDEVFEDVVGPIFFYDGGEGDKRDRWWLIGG
jgi:radical SAM-linked protein